MKALAVALFLCAGPALASCPDPAVKHYLGCVQASRSVAQQRACVPEIELDLEQWDEWEACKLKELAEKHQAEREAISERASSRRRSLLSQSRLLFQ